MYDIYSEVQGKNKHYFVLLNNWSPYKNNIRLKPWVTAYGRIIIANLILPNIENVFRVHTDGIVSYKPLTFDIKNYWGNNMWMETKTTGEIHWHHNNCYKNIKSKDYGKWLVKNKKLKFKPFVIQIQHKIHLVNHLEHICKIWDLDTLKLF
jgi:hypothetical protein